MYGSTIDRETGETNTGHTTLLVSRRPEKCCIFNKTVLTCTATPLLTLGLFMLALTSTCYISASNFANDNRQPITQDKVINLALLFGFSGILTISGLTLLTLSALRQNSQKIKACCSKISCLQKKPNSHTATTPDYRNGDARLQLELTDL
jgi:hypothetical protein